MKSISTTLGYDVFIAEPIPQNVTELVPNGESENPRSRRRYLNH